MTTSQKENPYTWNKKEKRDELLLMSLRSALEIPLLRNQILESQLGDSFIYDKIPLEITSQGNYTYTRLFNYLINNIFKNDNKIHVFSLNNRISKKDNQTHFQSFIVDNINKDVYAIDPARTNKGTGIYVGWVGEELENQLKNPTLAISKKNSEKLGLYKFQWVVPNRACQRNKRDVFCQSWSLLLQLNFIQNNYGFNLTIPRKKNDLYKLLLSFYSEYNELICPFIEIQYSDNLFAALNGDFNKDYGKYFQLTANEYTEFKKIDVCNYLEKLQIKDLL